MRASLASVIAGSVKPDDDDLAVTGEYRGRPTRFKIRVTFASGIIEVRTARQLLDAPSFDLKYDKDAVQPTGPAQAPDAWDQHDRKEQKIFFAPHVLLEGRGKELSDSKALMDRLPSVHSARRMEPHSARQTTWSYTVASRPEPASSPDSSVNLTARPLLS